ANMSVILYVAVVAIGAWLLYSKRASRPPKLNLPYLKFEGDNSAARYRSESESILKRGYERQSILTQIGGPGITEEVALAAREGLNRALGWFAGIVVREKRILTCGFSNSSLDRTSATGMYGCLCKRNATMPSMSACAIVGPELGGIDSEWQSLSMNYVAAALGAPGVVKRKYPRWLYWLSQYMNDGIKSMWKHRARARVILAPVLQSRIDATEKLKASGRKNPKGPRKYEDGVQWLLDAHTAHGKALTTDQLAQDLFVIMTASIHSTSGAGLAIIFDMLGHPDTLSNIIQEIQQIQSQLEGGVWTRRSLGDLRLLDSFMRESARVHALTHYTAAQRIPTAPWKFNDGLEIPAGTTMAFPSYHHNFDPAIHPNPETFDARRHLRKREGIDTHKFHFASASEDMLGWGVGRHACPGRFFAQETLNLLLIQLLTRYEFKYPDGTEEIPRFLPMNLFLVPNPALPILVKERTEIL
ncbi:Cytochrome P450 monooxygenase ccsG, partial [Lachnellula suecica]